MRTLALGSGLDPAGLYRRTGGNPFFVTEILASGSPAIPATVRDAVLARASRLSSRARSVLEAAAVAGVHCEPWLVGAVSAAQAQALAAPTQELQHLAPVAAARAEVAWASGDLTRSMPRRGGLQAGARSPRPLDGRRARVLALPGRLHPRALGGVQRALRPSHCGGVAPRGGAVGGDRLSLRGGPRHRRQWGRGGASPGAGGVRGAGGSSDGQADREAPEGDGGPRHPTRAAPIHTRAPSGVDLAGAGDRLPHRLVDPVEARRAQSRRRGPRGHTPGDRPEPPPGGWSRGLSALAPVIRPTPSGPLRPALSWLGTACRRVSSRVETSG